jgi:hypothetical protein
VGLVAPLGAVLAGVEATTVEGARVLAAVAVAAAIQHSVLSIQQTAK